VAKAEAKPQGSTCPGRWAIWRRQRRWMG